MMKVKDTQSHQKKQAKGSDTDVGKFPMNREKILATALTLFIEREFSPTDRRLNPLVHCQPSFGVIS